MRVVLASGAILSLAGGCVRASQGDWPFAALCALLFWACALLFVSYTSASNRVDQLITQDEEEREESRDAGGREH
jgi:hypothetical protein